MITEPTVFILGAGASKPYGYPTGAELRRQICRDPVGKLSFQKKVNDSSLIDSEKESLVDQWKKLAEVFFKSDTHSIDLFLNRNPDFSNIGKITIVHRILEAEKQSKFHEDIQCEYQEQNWYSDLFDRMTNELIKPDDYRKFGENAISFITFNYDRSLEQFLYESLQNSFYESAQPQPGYMKRIDQLKRIQIFHVYGCIGRLPWQGGDHEYKFDCVLKNILEMKDNIKLIHERLTSEIEEMKAIISKAKKIFFLGFGYAKENMEVLNIPRILRGQKIYGTAFGLLEERQILDIYDSFGKNSLYSNEYPQEAETTVNIKDLDCRSLLKKYL